MSTRAERIRPYPGAQYLVGRDNHTEQGGAQGLCQVLESRVSGLAQRTREEGWKAFPWLTLVIGSGCLEVPAASAAVARATTAAVVKELSAFANSWDGDRYQGLVEDFTSSLVEDRLMSGRRVTSASQRTDESGDVATVAAQITLAAALLTQLYHRVSTSYPRAMSRWEDDVAALDLERGTTSSHEIDDLVRSTDDVVRAAVRSLDKLREESRERTQRNVLQAVKQLLDNISHDLSKQGDAITIPVQRVRLLTEVAWYFLIRDTMIYPGWTDLLLRLMLAQRTRDQQRSPRRARPRYSSLLELAEAARSVLEVATEGSWAATNSGTDDALSRQRLYQAAAATLWAQADAHRSRLHRSEDLPPAAAFMTTLDIELEMALTATEPDRSFSVAVPAYVVADPDADEAEFCWLIADIPPAPRRDLGDLSRLRRPQDWRVLDQRTFDSEQQDRPLVIHLSGCPLIELPKASALSDELRTGLHQVGIDVTSKTVFVPAITVDEYLAMRQSEIEMSMLSRTNNPDPRARRSRGLPESLTQTASQAGTVRYWLVMGVPMADPAVRNRVLAQVAAVHRKNSESDPDPGSAGPLGTKTKLGKEQPSSSGGGQLAGAAVTLHIDDDEVALLHWLGLDVVEESSHAYSGDLLHYALHVRNEDEDKRPPVNEPCELPQVES